MRGRWPAGSRGSGHHLGRRVERPGRGQVGPIRLASTRPTTLARAPRTQQERVRAAPRGWRRTRRSPARPASGPVRVAAVRSARSEVQLQVGEPGVHHRRGHGSEVGGHAGTGGVEAVHEPVLAASPRRVPPLRNGPVSTPSTRCRAIQSGWRRTTSESGATRKGASHRPGVRPDARIDRARPARSEGKRALVSSQSPWRPGSRRRSGRRRTATGRRVPGWTRVGLGHVVEVLVPAAPTHLEGRAVRAPPTRPGRPPRCSSGGPTWPAGWAGPGRRRPSRWVGAAGTSTSTT